jgi:sugar phosphate isomerase/epimerase
VHIHAHDNDGADDLHTGVSSGSVDWVMLAEEVKKAGFRGTVIVESYSEVSESIEALKKFFS